MKAYLPVALIALLSSLASWAAPVSYVIDPDHTFPSFEADHMGISIWRGKLNKSTGKVILDKATGQGSVEVSLDLSSIDFGHDKLNSWATSSEFFDVANYPHAFYKGRFEGNSNGVPSSVQGELTLHGVTKPVALTINSMRCIAHPIMKRELCGADVFATFNRDEFGLDAGKPYGFKMDVTLRIQVEAIAAE
jgi:polyisoprenoid-binding protein YceI